MNTDTTTRVTRLALIGAALAAPIMFLTHLAGQYSVLAGL